MCGTSLIATLVGKHSGSSMVERGPDKPKTIVQLYLRVLSTKCLTTEL